MTEPKKSLLFFISRLSFYYDGIGLLTLFHFLFQFGQYTEVTERGAGGHIVDCRSILLLGSVLACGLGVFLYILESTRV